MFETIINFFKKLGKHEPKETNSKEKAKERLHLVLMQDRANVSADFLEMMKQEIIEVIKKYIEIEENSIDVRLTNEIKEDGTTGAPSLYANIPILHIRNEMKKEVAIATEDKKEEQKENKEQKETEDKKSEESEEKKVEPLNAEKENKEKENKEKKNKETENKETGNKDQAKQEEKSEDGQALKKSDIKRKQKMQVGTTNSKLANNN